jgi:hypothetical protein
MMEIWLRVYQDPESERVISDNALLTIKGKRNKAKFETAARLVLAEHGAET